MYLETKRKQNTNKEEQTMAFRDLYLANNKWYEVTELTIVFSGPDLETLTAKRALMLYEDFEVMAFNENVVALKEYTRIKEGQHDIQ